MRYLLFLLLLAAPAFAGEHDGAAVSTPVPTPPPIPRRFAGFFTGCREDQTFSRDADGSLRPRHIYDLLVVDDGGKLVPARAGEPGASCATVLTDGDGQPVSRVDVSGDTAKNTIVTGEMLGKEGSDREHGFRPFPPAIPGGPVRWLRMGCREPLPVDPSRLLDSPPSRCPT